MSVGQMPTTHAGYVTMPELAGMMGVSVSTIKRWTKQGMPNETWGIKCRRYRPEQAMAWARARSWR